jgi:hypothetical protein
MMKLSKTQFVIMSLMLATMLWLSPTVMSANNNEKSVVTETTLWFDDFESETVKWLGVGSGSVTRSTTMAMSGAASLNVTAQTWNIEEAQRQIGSPNYPLSIVTVDFWFSVPNTGYGYFVFGLQYCSANRDVWYRSGITLSGQYENETGQWANIEGFHTGWDLTDNYSIWHHARLSVDLANGRYISLTIDDYTFDLESLGYKCYDRTVEGNPVLWGSVYPYFFAGGGYSSCSILIDDVMLQSRQ